MKKGLIIPSVLIGTLLVTGSAFAWPGGHGNGNCNNFQNRRGQGMTQEQHVERVETRLERMGVILDLTDQQKGQLKSLFEKQWQDRQAMRTEMQTSREDLRTYRQGKNFNENEFRAKAKKHADLRTEMMVQHARTKQQIFAILTPEQQQKAEHLRGLDNQGSRGKHGRGGRGYGMGPANRF